MVGGDVRFLGLFSNGAYDAVTGFQVQPVFYVVRDVEAGDRVSLGPCPS